ncbi:ras-related C3 botulinum toxin substrate 3 [Histomonas meleagridis]|uniref:ras-related C3 botulinum toxin substrate 3 n=1 Tax=Histomonas meleagridis TaxID=135588 RepID=UPI0035596759|nr:ras-related C3 botulinum toxin substrate 3 [Histomonas meleagridis]KAH0804985.1 ras-related C3 botulinum toxin substrate 3 [Histomonas meleagridis]
MVESVKCTVVGDSQIGKTSLIVTFCSGWFPKDYIPTETNNFSKTILFDDNPIDIRPFDTMSQEEYEEIRSITYEGTDVFIICFSLIEPKTLESVESKWIKEAHDFSEEAPIVLVGLKKDLRDSFVEDPNNTELKPIPIKDGQAMKEKIGAYDYIECSCLTKSNIDKVFETALKAVTHQSQQDEGEESEPSEKPAPVEQPTPIEKPSQVVQQPAPVQQPTKETEEKKTTEERPSAKTSEEQHHQEPCNLL